MLRGSSWAVRLRVPDRVARWSPRGSTTLTESHEYPETSLKQVAPKEARKRRDESYKQDANVKLPTYPGMHPNHVHVFWLIKNSICVPRSLERWTGTALRATGGGSQLPQAAKGHALPNLPS